MQLAGIQQAAGAGNARPRLGRRRAIGYARGMGIGGRSLAGAVAAALLAAPVSAQQQPQERAETPLPPQRLLDTETGPWRTVRSGEGLRATVLGIGFDVPSRDRSSVTSWDAGIATVPGADDSSLQPNASLYLWRHQPDGELLRAVLAGVYDDVLWARPFGDSGLQTVLTFVNDTLPAATSELVDGTAQDREQLAWGFVRPGVGVGSRTRIGPQDDNLLALDLLVEPGLLYFARGDRTDAAFEVPDTTFELRTRLQARLDLLERNLLELPHDGFAAGADVVWGWRAQWSDWGLPGVEFHRAHEGRDYVGGSAYALGVSGVPFVDSERDRLVASVHAGAGDGLDRFSAPRVGGGPDRRGIEFETTARPLLPGAAHSEFFPEHYAIGSLGYRREIAFFAFVSVDATVGWLDRDRQEAAGRVRRDGTLTAVSARLSSGFFGRSRFQLGYAYDFDVVRDGDTGGSEVVLQFTGRF